MGMQIANTASTVPVSQGQPLKPLNRRTDTQVRTSIASDSFVSENRQPKALKTFAPLGIGGRATLVDSPAAPAATLSETFAELKTVGGGPTQARLLPKNLDAWNARWDMLTSARTSIDASYFSVEKDVFGYAFLGAMLKKQMEGVPVRIMTDAVADSLGIRGFTTPLRGREYLQEIVNHGGQAYAYNPVWQRPRLAGQPGNAALASNHDKILVVDGQRSVTGGRNIGIDYMTEAIDRKGAWRDMDIALEGAGAAKGLRAAFDAEVGDGTIARPIGRDLVNLSKKDIQLIGAYEMMNLWLNDPVLPEAEKASLRTNPAGRQALADDLMRRAVAKLQQDLPANLRREPSKSDLAMLKGLASQLVEQLEARGSRKTYMANRLPEHATETKIVDQTSAAAKEVTNGIAPALKKLVDSARTSIVIQNPYVVLTEDMLKSLEAASKRGVKIDIITNSPLSTDSAVTQAFFLEDWQMVLARCENARIFVATGDRKFHTKSAVIDGEQSFVSTYNLDYLSGRVNSEVGAIVKSPEIAADLLNAFQGDLADKSNGFIEYTIEKDAEGRAVLKDGKPIRKFGPEDHLPQAVLEDYAGRRQLWGHTLRNKLPHLAPLRHPERLERR